MQLLPLIELKLESEAYLFETKRYTAGLDFRVDTTVDSKTLYTYSPCQTIRVPYMHTVTLFPDSTTTYWLKRKLRVSIIELLKHICSHVINSIL